MKSFDMIIKTVFVLSFLSVIFNSYSQTNNVQLIKPVTPDMASLFKVVERPVGTFTGTVPVDIPIYTLEASNISIPVVLSYNMGGIKVEEVASKVGLGWSLSAGGAITRIVQGISDDNAAGVGYLDSKIKPSDFVDSFQNPANSGKLGAILRQERDIEPDIYLYNFNGNTGKFYFDEEKNIIFIEKTGIKAEPIFEILPTSGISIKGWIFTDLKGSKFYFGTNKSNTIYAIDKNVSTYTNILGSSSTPTSGTYTTTWHLLQIEDINQKNTVLFEYASRYYILSSRSGGSHTVSASGTNCQYLNFDPNETFVSSTVTEYSLSRITARTGSVVFNCTTDRIDQPGASKVNSIDIFTPTNELIKSFKFNYDYFTAPNYPGNSSENNKLYKRLKLTSLEELGPSSLKKHQFDFTYEENIQLPHRTSKAIDYWGYYNGKNNLNLEPNGVYHLGGIRHVIENMGDRRAYDGYAKANTLKKIQYPTGGYREYEMETNQALIDENSQLWRENRFLSFTSFETLEFLSGNSWDPRYTQSFSVNSTDGFGKLYFYSYGDVPGTGSFSVKITRIISPGNQLTYKTFDNEFQGMVELPNGNYRLDLYYSAGSAIHWFLFEYGESTWNNAVVNLFNIPYSKNNVTVGGVRVKSVTDYDPVTAKTYKTKYEYNLPAFPDLTSGLLVSPIVVFKKSACSNFGCDALSLYSSSCYPLTAESGSYVVYPFVRTIEEGNGFIDRSFSFAPDEFPNTGVDLTEFPSAQLISNSALRGKLLKEEVFTNSATLVKSSTTHYAGIYNEEWDPSQIEYPFNFMESSQLAYKVGGHFCNDQFIPCSACWNTYEIKSKFLAPLVKIEKMYSPTGILEINTNYKYWDNKGYPMLQSERTTLSNGHTQESIYKYSFNTNNEFSLGLSQSEQNMKDLLLQNNYLLPIETTVFVNKNSTSQLIKGNKLIFDLFNGNEIYPKSERNHFSLTDYKEQVFLSFDMYGNILEKKGPDGITTSYVWDYNGAYLVAEVLNAAVKDVFHTSFEDQEGNSTTGDAKTGNKSRTGGYSKSLNGLTNGNYTLTYWQKSGSNWTLQTNNISVTTNTYTINITNQVDELRFYPTKAQMMTYTYNPLIGMTSQCNAANMVSYYEYDNFGRLQTVRDQNRNVLKTYDYKYQVQQ